MSDITLFFVACEPALSGYQYANDFYHAITAITSGLMLPLTTANLLAHAIIGSVLENMDMDRIVREVGQAVAARILNNNESVDDVARELHEKLLLRNESTKKLVIENIYRESPEATHNVEVWTQSGNLAEGKGLLKKVKGPRFTDKYLAASQARKTGYSSYTPKTTRTLPTPSTSPIIGTAGVPTSPPRKVVTDFKTFTSPTSRTVQSVSVPGSDSAGGIFGPRPSTFSHLRERSRGIFGDDDDDDEDREPKEPQHLELRDGDITFDQAKRIALSSAWRGLGS